MLIVSATTAVTSNVATASIFVPVVAGLADSCDVHPLRFMLPVTLTCSLAFVLPVLLVVGRSGRGRRAHGVRCGGR